MKLSNDFVQEGLEKAKGFTFMGVPIEDLTREELMAVAVSGWEAERSANEEMSRRTEFLLGTFGRGQL